jgi:flagellar hook-associated protein 2
MAGLSSPGLATGLDVNNIISKLMELERLPLTRLATKETAFQAKISAYGALKSALSSLNTAVKALAATDAFTNKSASVSDTTVLAASASSTAAAGSYDIAVTQLAKAHTIHTNVDYRTLGIPDTFDTGTLRITIGTGTPVDINLASSSTLSGIRDAINLASAGVTAAIINDGTVDRLVLTSQTTGAAGAIAVAAPTTNNDGTRRLTDLIGGNLTMDQAAQNAQLTINGFAITRSSNTITDALTGVTLTVAKGTVATPGTTTLTVAANTTATTTAIGAFVTAYNDATSLLKTYSAYNAATKTAAALTGDSTVQSLQSQLSSLVQSSVTGIAGGISTLSDLGIAMQTTGKLTTDSAKLGAALADPNKDVISLFTQTTVGNEGIAVRFYTALTAIVGFGGQIANRTDGITASIKEIGNSRDALNLRLVQIEARYRARFTALDTLATSMNKTSQYLTQQLSNLPSTTQ